MRFIRFVFLAVVCSFIAAGVRLVVFGRPQASVLVDNVAQVDPGVDKSAQVDPGVDKSAQVSPGRSVSLQDTPGQDQEDQAHQENAAPVVQVVGYVKRGRQINLWLSDGRFLTERDPELTEVRKNYAVISGQRVWFVRPSPGRAPTVENVGLDLVGNRSEAERSAPL